MVITDDPNPTPTPDSIRRVAIDIMAGDSSIWCTGCRRQGCASRGPSPTLTPRAWRRSGSNTAFGRATSGGWWRSGTLATTRPGR